MNYIQAELSSNDKIQVCWIELKKNVKISNFVKLKDDNSLWKIEKLFGVESKEVLNNQQTNNKQFGGSITDKINREK